MDVDCNGIKEKEKVERTRDLKHEDGRVIICFLSRAVTRQTRLICANPERGLNYRVGMGKWKMMENGESPQGFKAEGGKKRHRSNLI